MKNIIKDNESLKNYYKHVKTLTVYKKTKTS